MIKETEQLHILVIKRKCHVPNFEQKKLVFIRIKQSNNPYHDRRNLLSVGILQNHKMIITVLADYNYQTNSINSQVFSYVTELIRWQEFYQTSNTFVCVLLRSHKRCNFYVRKINCLPQRKTFWQVWMQLLRAPTSTNSSWVKTNPLVSQSRFFVPSSC